MLKRLVVLVLIVLGFSCKEVEVYPKPEAKLALEYPTPIAHQYKNDRFEFSYNEEALLMPTSKQSFSFYYPKLKASVFMYYLDLSTGIEKRLFDLEQKVADHQKMASEIIMHPFVNPDSKSRGAIYEIKGNAASQAQFYISDNKDHFIHGALYFKTKPNYDSILPAANYVMEDLKDFMESIRWN
jgi:gliding motility-associated lipoprotein GldD